MRRVSTTLCGLALALSLSACSTGLGGAQPRSAESEIARLKEHNLELRRQAAMHEVEISRLRQQLAALEQELSATRQPVSTRSTSPSPTVPPPAASVPPAAESPSGPVTEPAATGLALLGDVEETDLEDPEPPTLVAEAPPAERNPDLHNPPATSGAARPKTVEAPPHVEAPPTASGDDAQTLYDRGYTLFHQKRYADAEKSFRQYLDRFPGTALADNAHFWIGESRYARGDFSSALRAFSETVELYPDGNKVPDALVKAGKCLEALGQRDRAMDTYREVIDRFGGSVAALTAEERLAALRR